jgi:hypothetical protein
LFFLSSFFFLLLKRESQREDIFTSDLDILVFLLVLCSRLFSEPMSHSIRSESCADSLPIFAGSNSLFSLPLSACLPAGSSGRSCFPASLHLLDHGEKKPMQP